jgi:hypothetical protein
MLFCGKNWKPQSVDRVIEILSTSTRPAKVKTDLGNGFLKGMGNPVGNESLALEIVGSELAAHIGLLVPDFAILELQDIDIPTTDGGLIQHGPAFISKEVDGVMAGGLDQFLTKLLHPEHVSLLVLFDTWIRNFDRFPPPDSDDPSPRLDNLLFTIVKRKFNMVVFDHTHAFVETTLDLELENGNLQTDNRLFGVGPGFEIVVNEASVNRACDIIKSIDSNMLAEIVDSVPVEWGPTTAVRDAWVEALEVRQEIAVNVARQRFCRQGVLDV